MYTAPASHSEKLGTILVELSYSDVRVRVMKAKQVSANAYRLQNMKTQAEVIRLILPAKG